jgi:acetylxylan esterase
MLFLAATLFLLGLTSASPIDLLDRRSCPNVHVFGAQEITASPGYGTAKVVVNLILAAYPGATSEAIPYPACGGQASCGGISYAISALQGVSAVAAAVNSFSSNCPNT